MPIKPNQCVILGIDSGKVSGWCIFISDDQQASGIATSYSDLKEATELALACAKKQKLPLVIGREAWNPGWTRGKRTFNSIVGTGASWGRWEAVLEETGFPKSRIFKVLSTRWRRSVLSLRPGRYNREQAKEWAIHFCKCKGWYAPDKELDHNQAEATCIAYFFVYDDKVAKAIQHPGRLKKL